MIKPINNMVFMTSMSKGILDDYGALMISSFHELMPGQTLHVFSEDIGDPIVPVPGAVFHNLRDFTLYNELDHITGWLDVTRGKIGTGYEYSYDVHKFFRKAMAQIRCHELLKDKHAGKLFWFDSDIVFEGDKSPTTEDFFNELLPDDKFMCYLGRRLHHSCTSFVGWNLAHAISDVFWKGYEDIYRSGVFLTLPKWDDCTILDEIRMRARLPAVNLTPQGLLTENVFDGLFEGRGRHYKGQRKEKIEKEAANVE